VVDEDQLEGLIAFLPKLILLFFTEVFRHSVLFNFLTKLICLQYPLVEGIVEAHEDIELFCPVEDNGVFIILWQELH